MKVIFLDNDGVICLQHNWGTRNKKWSKYRLANPSSSEVIKEAPVEIRFDNFDKKAITTANNFYLKQKQSYPENIRIVTANLQQIYTIKQISTTILFGGLRAAFFMMKAVNNGLLITFFSLE